MLTDLMVHTQDIFYFLRMIALIEKVRKNLRSRFSRRNKIGSESSFLAVGKLLNLTSEEMFILLVKHNLIKEAAHIPY
ncbi:hypothetical protein PT277_02785 [Acetobacteraceae bacterium ESL0709]|nr:hypothetical protein [Acetobacteraceae bacterium ESL0709]